MSILGHHVSLFWSFSTDGGLSVSVSGSHHIFCLSGFIVCLQSFCFWSFFRISVKFVSNFVCLVSLFCHFSNLYSHFVCVLGLFLSLWNWDIYNQYKMKIEALAQKPPDLCTW